MIILVSDTSVLIDLERAGLLEAAFSCGLTMVVPDLLYQRELQDFNGPYLRKLGLSVVSLTPQEVRLAQEIKTLRSGLSLPDCFALTCAHRPGHILISGDKTLRSEAVKRIGSVYGLLWIIDQMEVTGMLSKQVLYDGLTTIFNHPRCRLPKEEVLVRLAKWTQ